MYSNINTLSEQSFATCLQNGAVLFDARLPEEFINSFIPGAVFVGPSEKNWRIAVSLFNNDSKVILILPEVAVEDKISNTSFINIEGYLEGGFSNYLDAKNEIDLLIEIEADEFAMDIPFDANMLILDVREPDDFEKEHVKTALNIPLSDMGDLAQIAGLEENQNIYLYGEDVIESVMAASLLKRQGYNNLRVIKGGWQQIKTEPSIAFKKESTTLKGKK
ncbi:MAG: rhodanese-like domain-containing protein [Ginsengibacter sp.]